MYVVGYSGFMYVRWKNRPGFSSDVSSEGEGGGVPYKVDINHDALKGWGKEKPNKEKVLLIEIWATFPWTEILTD